MTSTMIRIGLLLCFGISVASAQMPVSMGYSFHGRNPPGAYLSFYPERSLRQGAPFSGQRINTFAYGIPGQPMGQKTEVRERRYRGVEGRLRLDTLLQSKTGASLTISQILDPKNHVWHLLDPLNKIAFSELRELSLAAPPADLFRVPSDWKVIDQPDTFQIDFGTPKTGLSFRAGGSMYSGGGTLLQR